MTVVENLTDENFDDVIIQTDVPVVVDFWADWCGPCRKVSPLIEQLAEEWQDKAKVVKLNIDDAPLTGVRQKVMGLPTIAVFKDGERVIELTGQVNKDTIKAVVESQF